MVGYATCGGLGFSTGKYGLGADNIVSARVVLADGSVVEASEASHPDLYWGLRGGEISFRSRNCILMGNINRGFKLWCRC